MGTSLRKKMTKETPFPMETVEVAASALPPVVAPIVAISRITPMYQAINAMRYVRKELIGKIQGVTGRKLICYVAGSVALIHRDDTLGFVDLLHNIQKDDDLDLMLNTAGGDMDAAEKLISLVRAKVGSGRLRIVVPDYAKSSGTLIATGADVIVMSDSSELGPIDPQITLNDGHGNYINHSVQSYLDAYKTHVATLRQDPQDVVAKIMLAKLDPATVKLFEAALARAREFAEKQLKQGMLREPKGTANWSLAASNLIDTQRWLSHGQVISPQDAIAIGLEVEYHEPRSEIWTLYWQLYALQRTEVNDKEKLFESDYASFKMDS